MTRTRLPTLSTTPINGVKFECAMKFDINELSQRLSPEQFQALFRGIAQVIAVGDTESLDAEAKDGE